MMISNPGSEKIVENASEELSFKTLLAKKSAKDLFNIFHVLLGAINGKKFMQIINHT
jgi:hypothetical protein